MIIDMDDNCADEITYKSIKRSLESLEEDLKVVNELGKCVGVFSWTDYELERNMILEIIDAHKLTLEWFKPCN